MAEAPAPAKISQAVLIALLVLTGMVFGLLITTNRLATENGVPPLAFVFWYAFGTGLIYLVACALRHDLPRWSFVHIRFYGVMGLLALAFPMTLMTYLAPKLPSGVIVVLQVLSPLLTYLISLVIRLERFRVLSIVGILLGLIGVLLIVLPSASLPSADMAGWVLLAVLAPVSFAAVNVLAAVMRPPKQSSLSAATGLLLFASALLFLIMLATGQTYAFPGPSLKGDLAILCAVFLNLFLWILFFEIVRVAGPVFFAQFNYIAVLTGFVAGILLYGEQHTVYIFGAAILMCIGLAAHTIGSRLATRARRKEASLGEA
jgi:drug/metabolite transporter (DMT)-like permease